MRSVLACLVVLAATSSSSALAGDKKVRCNITAEKGDRVVQSKTLIVEKGETVQSAVAIDGDVVIRAGANVKTAVAINGEVILEPGAKVTEDVVAIGGDLKLSDGSKVGKNAVALGGQLRASDAAKIVGERVSVSLGRDMLKNIVSEFITKNGGCEIVEK